MWSVVNFSADNSVEVVPSFWVEKNKCAWPKKKAIHFIKNRILPNNIHEFDYVTIKKKMCKDLDDYALAKARAKKSEVTSNVSSEFEYDGNDDIRTRHRIIKKREKNKTINKPLWSPSSVNSLAPSDEDNVNEFKNVNSNLHDESIIESPFSSKKLITDSIISSNSKTLNFKRKLNFSPKLIPLSTIGSDIQKATLSLEKEEIIHTTSSPFKVTKIATPTVSNLEYDILNKINRTTLNTWYEMKSINDKIDLIQTFIMSKNYNKDEVTTDHDNTLQDDILCNLPMTSEENLAVFEEKLLNYAFKKKMIKEMSRLVRVQIASTVRAMIRYLFSDNVLKDFSYKGQKKKKVFSTLGSCSLIYDSIRSIGKFKNCNTIDVEIPLKTFIAGAKFRIKNE